VQRDQLSEDLASLKIDRGVAPRGGSTKAVVIVIAIVAIVAIAALVVYPKVNSSLFTAEVKLGEITLVSPAQAQVQLTATGYVVALVYAKVASKVPGRIVLINHLVGPSLEENMSGFFPYFRAPPSVLIGALVAATGLGLIAGAIPALGASRLKVTDALRRVD